LNASRVSSPAPAWSGFRPLRVVGIFRTGNAGYDEGQAFVLLKRAQALLGRENRVNRVIIQLADPYDARSVAQTIEAATGYKSVSWVEASEDILSLLLVRNVIMFSVVSAILVVAAFGIYNTISTIVMEKTRDIAIMKAMGFHARDLKRIFLLEGLIVGVLGSGLGVLLGLVLMRVLGEVAIRPPGVSEVVHLPIWWGAEQYALAILFAMRLQSPTGFYQPPTFARSLSLQELRAEITRYEATIRRAIRGHGPGRLAAAAARALRSARRDSPARTLGTCPVLLRAELCGLCGAPPRRSRSWLPGHRFTGRDGVFNERHIYVRAIEPD